MTSRRWRAEGDLEAGHGDTHEDDNRVQVQQSYRRQQMWQYPSYGGKPGVSASSRKVDALDAISSMVFIGSSSSRKRRLERTQRRTLNARLLSSPKSLGMLMGPYGGGISGDGER
ncbi:hypothetical protein BV898_18725 [Hypsibius exemplaris]|uniref:Uncharacterized protein n=1 Tax=Hypsibius exemplaris TaxID=2072580 RepID=A0A9X6NIA2_HYPEX|nr:hypothetical protein BV898_18725 [Hypsibius exemplaris]